MQETSILRIILIMCMLYGATDDLYQKSAHFKIFFTATRAEETSKVKFKNMQKESLHQLFYYARSKINHCITNKYTHTGLHF